MSSARKVEANRKNSRASTGPKSAAGKVRSARNARRHSLSIPIWVNPDLSAEAGELAREIARADTREEVQTLSRTIAELQVDLRRIGEARHDLIVRAFDPSFSTLPERQGSIDASLARSLALMDRYERRALSRRTFAIRRFDALSAR